MPTIAIFSGIIIQMFFEDHSPPHVHAIYGEFKALVHPGFASPQAGEFGKVLGGAQASRVDGELASCTDGRGFRVAGPAND